MHEPVLVDPVLEYLAPKKGELYLDVTAGYGGHAEMIFKKTQKYMGSTLVDRDQMAIDHLRTRFASKDVTIIHDDYYIAAKQLAEQGNQFDLILADLGVSSPHLNIASRGFSFMASGPLDMRMDQRQQLTAETIVNKWSLKDLEQLIRKYGEEPYARRIAKSILANRPLKTTGDLAATIVRVLGKRQGKHPATRTFQALRIAVNNELELLANSLPLWVQLLKPGGRIAVISFHSLEDRIIKQFFNERSKSIYDADLKLLTKYPITASDQEIVHNPRSRSAKLRAAVKIKITERASDANKSHWSVSRI